MKCPVCRAAYRKSTSQGEAKPCRRCGTDLSTLIQIHDSSIAHHRAAIEHFVAGDLEQAIVSNSKAIALHSQQASFHAFAFQLSGLQGNFDQAVRSWQRVQALDPNHEICKVVNLFAEFR